MKDGLPEKQKECYDFIVTYKADHGGNSPSLQQIASSMAIAVTVARVHVQALMLKGYVKKEPGQGRSFEVIK